MGLTPHLVRAGAVAMLALLASVPALGQQGPAGRQQPAPAAAPKGAPQATGDAALRQRVEQLEEQLVDMQVVIGTLESLARGGDAQTNAGARANPGAAAAVSASDAGRLDAMETQIRALAAQLEQLQEQMRTLTVRNGALPPTSTQAANDAPIGAGPYAGGPPGPGRPPGDATADRGGFGSVTVSSDGEKDEIGKIINTTPGRPGPRVAAAPPESDAGSKQVYETAYGHLLQRDYGAAEAAFEEFLRRYPNDPLAGNAQYWLGESLYVRGQYRAAAGAFLKGYQTYGRSAKAPESLLKLAMSLQRLGQKDAACSSFSELTTKFPNAPPHVKTSAQVERQRAGC